MLRTLPVFSAGLSKCSGASEVTLYCADLHTIPGPYFLKDWIHKHGCCVPVCRMLLWGGSRISITCCVHFFDRMKNQFIHYIIYHISYIIYHISYIIYHITPHHIISIMSNHIISYHIISYHIYHVIYNPWCVFPVPCLWLPEVYCSVLGRLAGPAERCSWRFFLGGVLVKWEKNRGITWRTHHESWFFDVNFVVILDVAGDLLIFASKMSSMRSFQWHGAGAEEFQRRSHWAFAEGIGRQWLAVGRPSQMATVKDFKRSNFMKYR